MAVSRILSQLTGFRLFDGTLLNQIIANVNNLTVNGAGRAVSSVTTSLTVTAVTNTDTTIAIPSGAFIQSINVYTTTAFTAVTDALLSVGSAAGGAQYVAATSIKAAGNITLAFVQSAAIAAALANFTLGTMFLRVAQSGGSTATGAATLVVTYSVPTA